MMNSLRTGGYDISAFFIDHRDEIGRQWTERVAKSSGGRVSAAETQSELLPMLDTLARAVKDWPDVSSAGFEELRALLAEYSRSRARSGFSPSETAAAVFALRDAVLSEASKNPEASGFAGIDRFSQMIDSLGLVTFDAYVRTRETIITSQAEQLLELSTPVVKLWNGILAVPLVGTLDSARTQVVMEALLQMLVSTESQHAIIDITGVPAVDTQVAQHLLKTVMAARLMGAECVISGIRPQIAQTIVALGVEFGDIITKATLADALQLMLQRSGYEVRKSERKA